MLAGGFYHSLSIKGQDLDVPLDVLWKGNIPSLFLKLRPHTTLSAMELSSLFKKEVMRFKRVDAGIATCLSPMKRFFEAVDITGMAEVSYLYELLPLLEGQSMLEESFGIGIESGVEGNSFALPFYTMKEINEGIEAVRTEFK
jgi:hypothetical protein